jgi:hypothetical protein
MHSSGVPNYHSTQTQSTVAENALPRPPLDTSSSPSASASSGAGGGSSGGHETHDPAAELHTALEAKATLGLSGKAAGASSPEPEAPPKFEGFIRLREGVWGGLQHRFAVLHGSELKSYPSEHSVKEGNEMETLKVSAVEEWSGEGQAQVGTNEHSFLIRCPGRGVAYCSAYSSEMKNLFTFHLQKAAEYALACEPLAFQQEDFSRETSSFSLLSSGAGFGDKDRKPQAPLDIEVVIRHH